MLRVNAEEPSRAMLSTDIAAVPTFSTQRTREISTPSGCAPKSMWSTDTDSSASGMGGLSWFSSP